MVAPEPMVTVAMPAWFASVPAVRLEAPVSVTDSTVVTLVNLSSVIVPAVVNTRVSVASPPSTVSVLVSPATVKLKVSTPALPWRLTVALLAVSVSAAEVPRTVSKPEIPPVPVAVPEPRSTVTALP